MLPSSHFELKDILLPKRRIMGNNHISNCSESKVMNLIQFKLKLNAPCQLFPVDGPNKENPLIKPYTKVDY